MKILHRGTDPKQQQFQFTCHSCKTVWIASSQECKSHYADPREMSVTYYYCDCPICGAPQGSAVEYKA